MVEAWERRRGVRSSASWQAVTCVNTEAARKYTMRRPTMPRLEEGWYGWDDLDDMYDPLRRGGR